jgi:hypothetical protein
VSDSRKVTDDLHTRLDDSRGEDLIEIVVELATHVLPETAQDGVSREEMISTLRETFEHASEVVEALIRESGGEVKDRAWINQTLRALVPVSEIERLAELDEVEQLDLTTQLEAEG